MPTAVERLLDSFLKIEGTEQGSLKLNNAFLKIDDDLLKLSNANADNFLKIEHQGALKIDFNVIGDAFLKLGADFHRVDTALDLIGDFVVKGLADGSVDVVSNLKAAFESADHKTSILATDLKIFGLDFLKLDTSPNLASFELKLRGIGDDLHKLSTDMTAEGQAFLKLSTDFVELGRGDNPLDLAYKEFGGELLKISNDFGLLAGDFLKLDEALHGSGGGAGRGEAGGGGGAGTGEAGGGGGAGKVGTAFMALMQDFHVLGSDLGALGHGAATVIADQSHPSFLASGATDRTGHG
jgi:hypothetical protein